MRIIYLTAMHGRLDTVDYCLNKSPNLERLFIYTKEEDGEFLNERGINCFQYDNEPLSFKWNYGIKQLKDLDFDAVCILGSDDYVSESFHKFICSTLDKGYDFIGFTDMYFAENLNKYYWSGYTCNRKGEPIGAGRVLTKSLLQKINFDLYRDNKNSGLDKMAWDILSVHIKNPFITSMKKAEIQIVDVKDGMGITKLSDITNLKLEK